MSKSVFFNLRPNARLRMHDTPKNLRTYGENDIIYDLHDHHDHSKVRSKKKYQLKQLLSIRYLIKKIYNTFPFYLINVQRVNESNEAELVYNWGAFAMAPLKRQIIEFDNPYCITFYDVRAFRLFLPILFYLFQRVHALTFMSRASLELFSDELGKARFEKIKHKCHIFYPLVNSDNLSVKKQNPNTRFLFVGLDPIRKGLHELLNAFEQYAHPESTLTIVSPPSSGIDQNLHSGLHKLSKISLLGTVNRDQLLNEIMPEHDILVLPSYQESFGMVYLEALAQGLGLIALDNFTTSELIDHEVNGYIVSNPIIGRHPLVKSSKDLVKISIPEFNEYLIKNRNSFKGIVEKEIGKAINFCEENVTTLCSASRKKYKADFTSDQTISRWKEILA